MITEIMMKSIESSGKFKKSMKKVRDYRNFKKNKYDEVIDCLVHSKPLPAIYDDHKSVKHSDKELQGMRILHLAPNLCMIYKIDGNTVYLYNIGSHQDTGLTEDM